MSADQTRPTATELDLTAIRERAAAATPGPWRHSPAISNGGRHVSHSVETADRETLIADRLYGPTAEFIAHARTDIPALLAEVDRLTAALAAEPSPCEMKQGEPYDFAWCETHDTTFPLGSVCRFDGRDPVEVYADEADVQRARAVRAELERDAQVEALDRVRKAVGNINRLDEYGAVPLRHWIRAIDAALRTHDVSSPRPTAHRVQAAKLAVKASRVTGRDVPPAVRRLAGETGDPE